MGDGQIGECRRMPAMPRKAPLTVVTLKNGPLSNGATDFLLIMKLMMILMLLVLMIMILYTLIVASSLMIQNFQSLQPVFISTAKRCS